MSAPLVDIATPEEVAEVISVPVDYATLQDALDHVATAPTKVYMIHVNQDTLSGTIALDSRHSGIIIDNHNHKLGEGITIDRCNIKIKRAWLEPSVDQDSTVVEVITSTVEFEDVTIKGPTAGGASSLGTALYAKSSTIKFSTLACRNKVVALRSEGSYFEGTGLTLDTCNYGLMSLANGRVKADGATIAANKVGVTINSAGSVDLAAATIAGLKWPVYVRIGTGVVQGGSILQSGSYDGAIVLPGGIVILDNVTIQNNGGYGIRAEGGEFYLNGITYNNNTNGETYPSVSSYRTPTFGSSEQVDSDEAGSYF